MTRPTPSTPTTSDRLATVLSYGALLLLGFLVYRIATPFLVPLAWAGILTIFFYPMHERIGRKVSITTASLLSTLAVTIVLVVPALFVLVLTAREGL